MDPRAGRSFFFIRKKANKVYDGYVTREGERVEGGGAGRERKIGHCILCTLMKTAEDKLCADAKCTYSVVTASVRLSLPVRLPQYFENNSVQSIVCVSQL